MAITFINTIQVKNISRQVVPLQIRSRINSPIFTKSGLIQLVPEATVEAEDDRFDIQQLTQLRRNGLIETINFKRSVEVTIDSGTGSS